MRHVNVDRTLTINRISMRVLPARNSLARVYIRLDQILPPEINSRLLSLQIPLLVNITKLIYPPYVNL